MRVIKVSLTNFRNYEKAVVELGGARNILLGENAQGKTNFLEAIELISLARSDRAHHDADLIRKTADFMKVEISFESRGVLENVSYATRLAPMPRGRMEKQIKINGLTQGSVKGLRGRLVTVSFKSADLNLLRGGPKYRRDWIDDILVTLKPVFNDVLSRYQKAVAQRNRLLKTLAEKGKVSVQDQDQMKVWDQQLAQFGAQIIKERMQLLSLLLPRAEKHQEHISGARELLSVEYLFRAPEGRDDPDHEAGEKPQQAMRGADVLSMENAEIAAMLLKMMRERRFEEIARKQSLVGPHRDDIQFCLNQANAVEFGSQGQQRSLVLSLKLAELERIDEKLGEPPVLLLDDVLAELDLNRQALLMSLLKVDMQTLITTTHLSGFRPEWLAGADFLKVSKGEVETSQQLESVI